MANADQKKTRERERIFRRERERYLERELRRGK